LSFELFAFRGARRWYGCGCKFVMWSDQARRWTVVYDFGAAYHGLVHLI